MCDRVVSDNTFEIVYCPDKYKTQKLCGDNPDTLILIRLLAWHIEFEKPKAFKKI